MGFGNSYKVLSPPSWEPKQSGSPGIGIGSDGGRSKRVLDFVKKWLLCGWNCSDQVASPGTIAKNRGIQASGPDSYVRPPRWKQFLRRVRAKSRKVQNACCEGLCFHPQQQPLNYCSTDSYERNFDRGREFWNDGYFGDFPAATGASRNPTFAAPASYGASATLHSSNSSTPILWEEQALEDLAPAPIWQRRMMGDHLAPIAVAAA